jgi:hypothetical protein
MRSLGGILVMILAASPWLATTSPAQAPTTLAGTTTGILISGATPPFANFGYYLLLPANTGTTYQAIGIINVADSSGAYFYARQSGSTALINFSPIANGPVTDTMSLSFSGASSGRFFMSANDVPGGYQSGNFQLFTGNAPGTIAGMKVQCTVRSGVFPFASAGSFSLITATGTNSYAVIGDGISTTNSSGTYSSSTINTSTSQVSVNDPVIGPTSLYFSYVTTTNGSYAARSDSTGGFQTGDFITTDISAPILTITSPVAGQRWSNSVFTVSGTAHDNIQVNHVYYRVNEGSWTLASTANQWTNWSGSAPLIPGTNQVQAYAQDNSGNVSSTNSQNLDYVFLAPAVVQVNGLGTVAPNYNGQNLELGRAYSMTATPATGFAFSNWTGTATSSAPILNFMMVSNLSVTANFVDVTRPLLSITSPGEGELLDNSATTIQGTANDNLKVAKVYYQLNNNPWNVPVTTNDFTNWFATGLLIAGTNTLRAFAVDPAGNDSLTNAVNFVAPIAFSIALSPISWVTDGFFFSLNTATGVNCRIDLSDDLVDWTVFTNLVTMLPVTLFRDPSTNSKAQRFYRAAALQP